METLRLSMENRSEEQLALLPEDTLASLRVLPGSDRAQQMTVFSGLKCSVSLRNVGPAGSLARMLLTTSIWRSTKCFLTWRVKRTPRKRLLYQLALRMPRISASEYGFWRTPMANEAGARVETLYTKEGEPAKVGQRAYRQRPNGSMILQSVTLNQQVQMMWPTPTVPNGGRQPKGGMTITGMTPDGKKRQVDLAHSVRLRDGVSGQLNPAWVEWLMGYPLGWTDIEKPD